MEGKLTSVVNGHEKEMGQQEKKKKRNSCIGRTSKGQK